MNRRTALMGLCSACLVTPADALETVAMPLDTHGYRSAPRRGDSIPWNVLGATANRTEVIGADSFVRPVFTPTVLALDGQRIRVNGYMNPMEESQLQRHFYLMAYPLSCPYCLSVGAQFVIDTRAPRGVRFTYDAILVEGRMELLHRDPDGAFYRLHDAQLVR
ncbi:MAG: hypothetical protein JNM47_13830 [Hyphomonadaceae bacterium]|nr:hypothetical protein [Hyphomonadaceae bacterium]